MRISDWSSDVCSSDLSERTIIIVHAWRWEDGNQTYSDPNVERVDGWCVYVRVPTGEPGEFDTPVEEDFPTQGEAEQRASQLAAEYGLHPGNDLCVEL